MGAGRGEGRCWGFCLVIPDKLGRVLYQPRPRPRIPVADTTSVCKPDGRQQVVDALYNVYKQ